MSASLVALSPDLSRLRDEGYDIAVENDHLLVRHVPYVTTSGEVAYGILISELTVTGSVTTTPSTHVAQFSGGIPCDANGNILEAILHTRDTVSVWKGMVVNCSFSSKPKDGYPDYYEKMVSYIRMLAGHAQALDASASAQVFPPVRADESVSVHRYLNSASGRAEITGLINRLAEERIAIIGLGGTGSYLLDQLAKTPVAEIRLYDPDVFHAHNAFRAPGAATIEELDALPLKAEYLQGKFDAMHRRIVARPVAVDETNVEELRDCTFVFLAVDSGPARKLLAESLMAMGIPFIDVGMGVERQGGALAGTLRVTTVTEHSKETIVGNQRLPFVDAEDDYNQNIQISELNAMNAMLAIIKWKKIMGIYVDRGSENSTAFTIGSNLLVNDDVA